MKMILTQSPTESCERCDRKLRTTETVYLEFNTRTNRYQTEGTVPAGDSQGAFPFGKVCARRVLASGGGAS